jgi:DNA-directed RNA polymerase II subunit RPB1
MMFINEHIAERKQNISNIIEEAYHDRLQVALDMTPRESFERRVERELSLARDTPGQYTQKNLKDNNNVKQMVVAGSNGSFITNSQISVCVGQQSGGTENHVWISA